MGKIKIYSNRHTGWWLPNFDGYTDNESEAGLYDMDMINNLYPDISFNDANADYLVSADPYTVVVECIDLLGRDGINSKKIAQHKLIDILQQLKELM